MTTARRLRSPHPSWWVGQSTGAFPAGPRTGSASFRRRGSDLKTVTDAIVIWPVACLCLYYVHLICINIIYTHIICISCLYYVYVCIYIYIYISLCMNIYIYMYVCCVTFMCVSMHLPQVVADEIDWLGSHFCPLVTAINPC